ncbi:rhodopsin [Halichoeres trimaculatus]|uniref:rhodopsin n=1 Tax=Halichoeres trimaculatus TaxID=147232 RepID=UPI003D9E8C88
MDAEEIIESIIRAFMFLAGVLGNNWLVIRSLPGQISGFRTNEVLLINLAISNLITNYLVDLPDTIADFTGRWFLGETYCAVFRFCADLSETSSIYTTFFISMFWHQKLVGSLKRGGAPVQLDSLRLIGCLLAGSWTVAMAFSIPHFFFVTVQATNDSEEDCVDLYPNALASQIYDIFYLTLANALPMAGILFVSVQIVVTLLRNQRRIQSHSSGAAKKEPKEKMSTADRSCDKSAGTSGPSTLKDPKETASLTVYNGTSCPPGQSSNSSSLSREPNVDTKAEAPAHSKVSAKPSSSSQVRAAKSVVAVASVFLVSWLTHILLRITNNFHTSSLVVEVASYVAASYTCIIPFIFLHGVKKLTCSCKR